MDLLLEALDNLRKLILNYDTTHYDDREYYIGNGPFLGIAWLVSLNHVEIQITFHRKNKNGHAVPFKRYWIDDYKYDIHEQDIQIIINEINKHILEEC